MLLDILLLVGLSKLQSTYPKPFLLAGIYTFVKFLVLIFSGFNSMVFIYLLISLIMANILCLLLYRFEDELLPYYSILILGIITIYFGRLFLVNIIFM